MSPEIRFQEVIFSDVQHFLEEKQACLKLMSHLNSDVEIEIIVGHSTKCRYFKQNDRPKLELGPSKNPDLTFKFTPEGIETLLKTPGENLDDLVVDIFKIYLAELVKIEFSSSIPKIILTGYFRVLKLSRDKLLLFLKSRGGDSLSQIPELIQKLLSPR